MENVEKFTKGSDLDDYSRSLAMQLHADIIRESGAPYTEHLRQVAELTSGVLKDSEFKPPTIACAWLHDAVEDIDGLESFNPFKPLPHDERRDSIYLNDLFEEAGKQGRWLCYMVDRITNRDGNYFDYMTRVFSVNKSRVRILDLLTLVVKIADRVSNSIPDEEINVDEIVKTYLSLEGQPEETLVRFYKEQKIIDAFSKKSSYGIDAGFLVETVRRKFREKQIANANDNLFLYLPMAERLFLVDIGLVDKRFEEEHATQNPVLNYERVRQLFRQCYEQSLRIVDELLPSPQGTHLYIVRMGGYNRGAQEIPGYRSVLSEIRRDMTEVPSLRK